MPNQPPNPNFDPYTTGQWPRPSPAPSNSDFARLETRIGDQIKDVKDEVRNRFDGLQELMQEMIRVQSEMGHQERRIEMIESAQIELTKQIQTLRTETTKAVSKLGEEVSKWVNRGVGAWGLVILAWTVWEKLHDKV